MRQRLLWAVAVSAFAFVFVEGCAHRCCRRPFSPTCPKPCPPPAPAFPPQDAGAVLPQMLPPQPPPPPAPVETRGYWPAQPAEPAPSYSWQPSPNGARAAVPSELPRLQQPVLAEPPLDKREATPPMPVGIPQFEKVRDQATAGLTPSAEGIDWLRANGYRTVLYLRAPGADETTDRKAVEKAGLQYRSLEVSPKTLAKAADDFQRIVDDPAHRPLFVYDKNGVLAGSLWYLYFRTVEGMPDESALRKATNLGLKREGEYEPLGEWGTMWPAIQEHIKKRIPSE